MQIIVPRLMDAAQTNAQNLNAKALLSRFSPHGTVWHAPYDTAPDPRVSEARNTTLHPLFRGRFWTWHMIALYQRPADAIFYPGLEWMDDWALRFRALTGRGLPIIATYEGIAGDEQREAQIAGYLGRPVPIHRVSPAITKRIDRILGRATHIIALSPQLQKIAAHLFQSPCNVLPIGYDDTLFHAPRTARSGRIRVVCAAGVRAHKRPALFLDLARCFQDADFCWFGAGELLENLRAQTARENLSNLSFRGPVSQHELASEMRASDILVLPSLSEGVPRITIEAAASGLAQVIFGHYQAPTVVDGVNGCVVGSDAELKTRLGDLIANRGRIAEMGRHGLAMAKAWTWDQIAPRWQQQIEQVVRDA